MINGTGFCTAIVTFKSLKVKVLKNINFFPQDVQYMKVLPYLRR